MCIPIRDINAFMPYPVCDCQSCKTHINQQTDMTVPQVMNPDSLYPSLLTAAIHFSMKVTFRNREYTIIRFNSIQLFQVVLNLVAKELRHLDHTNTFRSLRGSDKV